MPDNLNSSTNYGAIPTPQPRRLSARSDRVQTALSPLTATSAKPRKSARFTRIIVEKLLLEPEELHPCTEPNLEAGQTEATTKRSKHEMGPLVRSIEAFFLLLPMLGAMYMLGSTCMPYQWWRERLSIVRIPLAAGKGEGGSELLLSLWGWCVIQPGSESTCSEPKLLYTMDSFFSTSESRSKGGLAARSFNATTMKAFVVLLPCVAFTVIATCFVMKHIHKRCVKNDRQEEAGKKQHLAILLALLSTGAFWGIRQVFNSQLSSGLGPGIKFENGGTKTDAKTKDNEPPLEDEDDKQDSKEHVEETTDHKAKNRLTSLGKRMTKFFGSSGTSNEEAAGTKLEEQLDLKNRDKVEDVRSTMGARDAISPQERPPVEASDRVRPKSSVLKRLTLATMSAITKKQ
ncbi:hypothetical protein QFC21_003884 [Naganishia friedmannii]|uniref:Uncharacterized protein n=1 Tax=Naganishia friedmannii TaxID=89922 RepID=A0ACC2VKE6_9TREE|nr:hypothetical protein QFC21_003884 [Naganishia friedmannii]